MLSAECRVWNEPMTSADTTSCDVFAEGVRFATADGLTLAGELSYPANGEVRGVAWIANPHPFMGGQMSNNVVAALAAGLPAGGWAALRFDYRGNGASDGAPPPGELADRMSAFLATGHAPDDLEKLADVAAADDFLAAELGDLPRAGIGYSFGAYLLSERLRDLAQCRNGGSLNGHDLAAAVAVCPTLATHDFAGLARSDHRRLLICSDNDFATPADRYRDFAAASAGMTTLWFAGADHFFKGRQAQVARAAVEFLDGGMREDWT
ncbi:MAG: hypothetical protein BIFFINMI_02123 [Phycisphaerae bacterium]|nr:hypothetical protein [Phycisphaerae bacterium]